MLCSSHCVSLYQMPLLPMFSDGSDEAQVAASSSLEQAFITGAAAMGVSIDDTIKEILKQPDSAESTLTVSIVDYHASMLSWPLLQLLLLLSGMMTLCFGACRC